MKCSAFHSSTHTLILILFSISFSSKLPAQDFQRLYGTSLDNNFTKVIQHGANYYVLGQNQPTGGSIPHATVTYLDPNGVHQWTLTLDMPSIWNDAVLTPTGDLLVVGGTLPGDGNSQSLMGLVTASGGGNFTWVRSYDVPGRESNTHIVRNPVPENPAFPYYVLGAQWDPTGGAIWDDIILMNMDEAGTFSWKKRYVSLSDDEFARDLEALPNGDMILAGNLGTQGVVFLAGSSGTLMNGLTPGSLSFSFADVTPSSGGGYYAVGGIFPAFTAYLMKYDNNLINIWEATISDLTSVTNVWEEPGSGKIYVTGRALYNGINRGVVMRFTDTGTGASLDWIKYPDNAESAYTSGRASYLLSNQIAFADGRMSTTAGFGQLDAFMQVTDLELTNCMTAEDVADVTPTVITYNGPELPAIEFFDFSTGVDKLVAAPDWQQEDVCTDSCQADFIITPFGNCGHYQVTNTSTGAAPMTYLWCDGQVTEHIEVFLPCGPHTFCLTITDATGCTSSYTETITVTDNIAPIAVCQPGFGVVLDANCEYLVIPAIIDGGSSDNCQIQSLSVSPAILSGCGVFPVTLTVTDWCGNTSTCVTSIQTIEDIPPVITCPASVFVTANTPPPCKAVVNGLSLLSATDNCSTPSISFVVSGATSDSGQNDASGLTFNAGVSTVVYTATDDCGNTASCAFEVIVTCLPPCDTFSIILNTGWDNQASTNITPVGVDLDASPDLDWIVTADPINPPPPGGRPADVCGTFGIGWAQPFINSEWIAASPTRYEFQLPNPPYLFTNEIKFDLPTGYSYPNIDLQLRADELIHTAYLNNNLIYQFFPPHVDGGFNGPPLIVYNNTAAFFQTGSNILSVSYSDESGDVTGFNLRGDVTYCKDTCQCGAFSDMAIRFERGPGQPLTCGGPPVVLTCPPPGYSYTISGKFECQGLACPPTVPFETQIEEPNGTITTISNQSANPYFGIPISNLYFQQAGVYTVTLTGQCGSQTCTCVLQFIINDPCPDPCPCDIPDIQAFSQAVNQGFASVLSTYSCKACFTPIALSECETVEWYLNNTGGSPIGTSTGGNSFCYLFPGSGTYTVIMVATRKKADGTNCETFVKSQLVNITCLVWDECSAAVFDNPSFGEGAVAGDLDAGGSSSGWKKMKPAQPKTAAEQRLGSFDGWSINLTGNLESSGILTSVDPVCIQKDSGLITVRIAVSDSGVQVAKKAPDRPCDRLEMRIFRGDNFDIDITNCNDIDCYKLASIPLSELDTGWNELQIPYDLRRWLALDECGGSQSVLFRPAVYVTNALMNSQGGEDTWSYAQLDNFCFGGMIVAVDDPQYGQDFRIYPNPNIGEFTVEFSDPAKEGMSIVIVSLTGQILFEKQAVQGNVMHTVKSKDLAEGIYFLQIVSAGRVMSVDKFVKQ